MGREVRVGALLLEELRDSVDVDEIDDGQDELGLAAWNALAIWEQFATLVLDVLAKLNAPGLTSVKGEKASPLALGVL